MRCLEVSPLRAVGRQLFDVSTKKIELEGACYPRREREIERESARVSATLVDGSGSRDEEGQVTNEIAPLDCERNLSPPHLRRCCMQRSRYADGHGFISAVQQVRVIICVPNVLSKVFVVAEILIPSRTPKVLSDCSCLLQTLTVMVHYPSVSTDHSFVQQNARDEMGGQKFHPVVLQVRAPRL